MTYHVLPAEREDLRTLGEIFHDSFAANPEFEVMNRGVKLEDLVNEEERTYRKLFDLPGRRFFKFVDSETGQIVAFSQWWFPHTLTAEQKAAGVGRDRLPEVYVPGVQEGLYRDFLGQIWQARAKYLNTEEMYFVNILAVRSEYQRKGFGGLLLADGLKLADRDGAKTYIEASQKGLGLYRKFGWREFDAIVVDTRPYGGDGLESTLCMMREPFGVTNDPS